MNYYGDDDVDDNVVICNNIVNGTDDGKDETAVLENKMDGFGLCSDGLME